MTAKELAKQVLEIIENVHMINSTQAFTRLEEIQKLMESNLPQEFYFGQPIIVSKDGKSWRASIYIDKSPSHPSVYAVSGPDKIDEFLYCKPDPEGEREEYERLKKRLGIKNLDLVPHDGKECPCPDASRVLVLYKSDSPDIFLEPDNYDWTESGADHDIIAYAVLE